MDAVMEAKQATVRTKIVAAVLHYQNNHRGLSPTDEMICIESGLPRDVVRQQLREMEREGLLSDSRRWPRIIKINKAPTIDHLLDLIDPRQKLPANGAATSHLVSHKEEKMAGIKQRADRPWRETAKQIANFVHEYTKEYGRPPLGKDVAVAIGYNERATGMWRVVGFMREAGWLTPSDGTQHSLRLTPKGMKDLLGTSVQLEPEETVAKRPVGEVDSSPRFPAGRKAFLVRAKQVACIIDDLRDRFGRAEGELIRERLGMTSGGLSVITSAMVKEGWLEHKPRHHADYRLTNLGKTVLLHSAPVEQGVMEVEPPIEHAPQAAPQPRTAHPAMERPVEVRVRTIAPESVPEPVVGQYVGAVDLAHIDSLDLAIELQRRGWRVMR